ncbi:RlpA-like double-psi beta-barrel-protein domain-containing protein-containing protein, partial [Dimargaris cristalligena]
TDTETTESKDKASGETHKGEATYYDPGVGAGSCGEQGSSSGLTVAVNSADMANGANPNANPNCGRTVTIRSGGKSVQATVTDTCPGCKKGDLDLSPDTMKTLFPNAEEIGRGDIEWNF